MRSFFLAATLIAGTAFGQAFPSKPITMVVGFEPGGGTDTVARIVGKGLADSLRQQVVVENRAGAGGGITYGSEGSRTLESTGFLPSATLARFVIAHTPISLAPSPVKSVELRKSSAPGSSVVMDGWTENAISGYPRSRSCASRRRGT